MKIYTRTGDDGTTGLRGNARVRKDAARIEAFGSVDEANAALGVILAHLPPSACEARGWLDPIQNDLFVIGSILATPADTQSSVTLSAERIAQLEHIIDRMEKELEPLKNFILPQGVPAAASAHLARAITRRAERRVVALTAEEVVDSQVLVYVNRLADFLFVLARWINHKEGEMETLWTPESHSAAGATLFDQQQQTQDRMGASLRKLDEEKKRRQTLFEKAAADLQKKKEQAEKNFRQGVDQIKKEGGQVNKPIRDIDLD